MHVAEQLATTSAETQSTCPRSASCGSTAAARISTLDSCPALCWGQALTTSSGKRSDNRHEIPHLLCQQLRHACPNKFESIAQAGLELDQKTSTLRSKTVFGCGHGSGNLLLGYCSSIDHSFGRGGVIAHGCCLACYHGVRGGATRKAVQAAAFHVLDQNS
jgi:hypothetical protein